MKPELGELAAKVDAATENQLLVDYQVRLVLLQPLAMHQCSRGSLQPNVSDFFTNAVATLKQGGAEDFRCPNVIDVSPCAASS